MANLLLAAVGYFILISIFRKIPILGLLSWVPAVWVWVVYSTRLARVIHLRRAAGYPASPAMAGLWLGLSTALAGVLTNLAVSALLLANLFQPLTELLNKAAQTETEATNQALASISLAGTSLGMLAGVFTLLYWPIVGMLVCGILVQVMASRLQAAYGNGIPPAAGVARGRAWSMLAPEHRALLQTISRITGSSGRFHCVQCGRQYNVFDDLPLNCACGCDYLVQPSRNLECFNCSGFNSAASRFCFFCGQKMRGGLGF